MKFKLVLMMSALSAAQLFSFANACENGCHPELPKCEDIAQTSPVGTACRTETSRWTRVCIDDNYGWKDAKGVVWYDYTKSNLNQFEAQSFCTLNNLELPEKEDFEKAEAHGLREVFKDIFTDVRKRYLWTNTLNPSNDSLAYTFNGATGKVEVFSFRRGSMLYDTAQCVSR